MLMKTSSVNTQGTVHPFLSTEHNHHDGKCSDGSCNVQTPHNHTIPEHGCFSCIKSFLIKYFPLEEKIKHLEVNHRETNNTVKQLLLMASNLTPAILTSEILRPFHVTSFVSSPLSISAMHFTNRGTDQLPKLLFTSLSSIAVIALQKFAKLPRALIRPAMALAVLFIEKKPELPSLLKLQGQINTVPWIINLVVHKLKETALDSNNFVAKFAGYFGAFLFHIIGLSAGFVGSGKLIDKVFEKFNLTSNGDSLAVRTEGAVCACCGAPVCVAEVSSEVGSMAAVA